MCVLGILQKDGRKKTKPNTKNVPKTVEQWELLNHIDNNGQGGDTGQME